jgi:hypothetical protein
LFAHLEPIHGHEEFTVRYVIEPSLSVISRWAGFGRRPLRMPSPSPLPSIVPTRSSYLQRFLWLFSDR